MPIFHHHKKEPDQITVYHTRHHRSKYLSIVIVLGLIILTLALVYFLQQKPSQMSSNSNTFEIKPIYSQIKAQFSGQVTSINGRTLSVKDNNGNSDQFSLSSSATLTTDITGTPLTEANLSSKVPLNTDFMFFLQLKNGRFEIVSIQPIPNIPPIEESISRSPSPIKSGSTKKP